MTTTVTMLSSVQGGAVGLLLAGQTYTLPDDFAFQLIYERRATAAYDNRPGGASPFVVYYTGPWVGRPDPNAVPVGGHILVTGVGLGGRSIWWTDGVIWRPVGGSLVLAQSSLLTVLPGNGGTAITATGAITGMTALPYTPAGIVRIYAGGQAGLPAGIYWARYSSTAACQLYVDAAGTIPPSGITPGAFIGTTNVDTVLASVTIPGGCMGPNGALRVWRQTDVTNTANGKFVTTTLGGSTIAAWTINAGNNVVTESRVIRNRNSEAIQSTNLDGYSGLGNVLTSTWQLALNTATDLSLDFRVRTGNGSDFLTLAGYTVELLAG